MKYLLLLTLIFFSCKSSKKKYPPDSQMNIVASVTFPDGSKQLEIVVRLVKTAVDSTGFLKTDTQYFLKRQIPDYKLDSLGRKDTFYVDKFFGYNSDSINIHVGNVLADSLQSKDKK